MASIVFQPLPLPRELAVQLREGVRSAHEQEPFSPSDPRRAAGRVVALLDSLGLPTTVFRGGLDLSGVEVDHIWVALAHDDRAPHAVLDIAFPLFDRPFVDTLRRFVAGDARSEDLETAAQGTDIDARVLGAFPERMRYVGRPVWRHR